MHRAMMQPFQAVLVRYSGDASSGEWLNIGVVALSHSQRFMRARFVDSWKRVTAAFPQADPVHLRRVVLAIAECCERYQDAEHENVGIERAFDAILPREDASLIRSAAISGITENPSETLDELFERYVVARESNKPRRTDTDVWLTMSNLLARHGVLDRMLSARVAGRHYALEFDHAWQNGRWNVVQALSFDLRDAEAIATKAADWTGRIVALGREHGTDIHLIIGMPPSDAPEDVKIAAAHAEALLREQLEATGRAAIVREDSAEAFAERVAKAIRAHEAAE